MLKIELLEVVLHPFILPPPSRGRSSAQSRQRRRSNVFFHPLCSSSQLVLYAVDALLFFPLLSLSLRFMVPMGVSRQLKDELLVCTYVTYLASGKSTSRLDATADKSLSFLAGRFLKRGKYLGELPQTSHYGRWMSIGSEVIDCDERILDSEYQ
jgi:hypothetical protein